MNPDSPKTPREELELRLTALLLGELPEAEAAAWRAAIATNPELAKLHDRLKQTISLVREATAKVTEPAAEQATPLQLSEERREKLLAHFKTVKPKEFAPEKPRRKLRLIELAAAVAIIGALAAITLPAARLGKKPASITALPRGRNEFASETLELPVGGHPETKYAIAPPQSRASEDGLFETTRAKPSAQQVSQIVLPSAEVSESGSVRKGTKLTAERGDTLRSWSVRDSLRGFYVDNKSAEQISSPGKIGDPEWTGILTRPESARASTNQFLGRYAYVVPSAQTEGAEHFYRDLNRTLPATPTTADAGIAINGVEQSFAGRGVSPTSGLADDFSRDGAALGQTLAVTRANPALPRSYGLETANRESRARDGMGGGGAGGAITAGGVPAGPQNAPGQVAAGEVVAGFVVTPTPALQPAKLQESLSDLAAVAELDADKAPVLGESPTLGKLFRSDSPALTNRGRALSVDGTTPRQDQSGQAGKEILAYDSFATLAPPDPTSGGVPVASSPAQRSKSVQTESNRPSADAGVAWSEESLRRKSSSIVLPSVETVGKIPNDGAVDQLALGRKDKVEAETSVQNGRELLEAGKLADAEVKLHEAIKADPENRGTETLREQDAKRRMVQVGALAPLEPEVRAAQKKENVLREKLKTESIDTSRALSRYAELTGKTVLPPSNLPNLRMPVQEQSQASKMSKEEEIRALEVGLALNGISMIPVGEKFVKALPVSTANAAGAAPAVSLPLIEPDFSIRKPATNAPIPQPEIQTSENAFSTFSLNVSDVSFKLAAASLEKGQMPDQASIRSEEFINAFDYRDPEPQWDSASSLSAQTGKMPVPLPAPIAFAWERARYPFAHNRDLLRFSIKTGAVGRQAGRALNLVLLLDNSGSMERADRMHIIREALRVLARQLQPQDKISVITFARTPRLWVDGASGTQAGEVAEQVGGLTPQGGTNLEEAMNLAYQTALRHYAAGGINRVVMLTDGAANLGNVEPESLKQKVESHRKQGIALDCFGIGWEGFNDDLLEVLSRNGDGRYGFINSPEEAATEFAGQLAGALQVAASDVKVQVEFNPARVKAYRQIGYAKHQLTKEQFRDNTVDAAEIAAQEAGNALYTAEVNPAGEGPLCIVRVRFKFPGTVVYREHEWAVPYNGSAVSLEQASPAMRLAASASAFSEWLVASPFAAEVALDALIGYLSGVPEIYGADARPKKLEWMIRQAKSIEGK
ncbi:MAG: von Willebrand factor type A domain-containing protein [Verrucomicrobia bacterium]|nr:von Willebrand factor type A domain-containing protein [Verrucomicrobiota bacterium]